MIRESKLKNRPFQLLGLDHTATVCNMGGEDEDLLRGMIRDVAGHSRNTKPEHHARTLTKNVYQALQQDVNPNQLQEETKHSNFQTRQVKFGASSLESVLNEVPDMAGVDSFLQRHLDHLFSDGPHLQGEQTVS